MNKEEIEELKDFTIDLTDIDELALGLEVCSKKSNMVIQEFADTIIQLQQENQELHKHLEVPEPCNLKTLEDYKSYYEDTTKEQILADTYIDYCAYVNLAHRYAELKKQLDYLRSEEYYNQLREVEIIEEDKK